MQAPGIVSQSTGSPVRPNGRHNLTAEARGHGIASVPGVVQDGLVSVGVWERVDVSHWPVLRVEQVGSTQNHWLEEPSNGSVWLHKDTVIPRNGVEQGEDWSEVVSTQVAGLLGVPCATTRLCSRAERRGSLSLSIVPKGQDLWEGTVFMQNAGLADYFPHAEGRPGTDPSRPTVRRPGHSLANIRRVLSGVVAPPSFSDPSESSGFDVFAGYMIFDALIANRDRHEQNWAVLAPRLDSTPERLAPSYDHASSLGYNVTDPRRSTHLQRPGGLQAWAEKGTAYRFEHDGRPPTLVEHARKAVALCPPQGADWWRNQLDRLDLSPVLGPLHSGEVPGMSEVAARFAHNLLDLNLRRLRDAICNRA